VPARPKTHPLETSSSEIAVKDRELEELLRLASIHQKRTKGQA